MRLRPAALGLAVPALVLAASAGARTLGAGPNQEFDVPSRAIAAAQAGDTVLIEPGTYYDCTVWSVDRLTIAGRGPGVVLSDTTCEGKAVLVIRGSDTVVRDLALARARVPDGNGAGIRLEGHSLRLERVRFLNNEVGVLAGATGGGTIQVVDCQFEGGGIGDDRPSFALLIGPVATLRVKRSAFTAMKGNQIGSAALLTEVIDSRIATSRLAVSAAGGALLLTGNVLELTPDSEGRRAAVLANGGAHVTMRRNQLVNRTGRPATLLLDWTGGAPVLEGNVVEAGDHEVRSDGVWRHRAGTLLREARHGVRGLLDAAKHQMQGR